MAAVQQIPLSKLKAGTQNVRKTGGKKVDDLVASIAAHGLRQNLTVIEAGKGFEVVAGGRRLRALQLLAKAGKLPGQLIDGVPCMVVDAASAAEISLAENTIREAMHPLDQFSAFQTMTDAGKPLPDIAAAFGVSELVVKQRLRLARVSPKLLKAYGDGEMKLDQLQAFAVTDDHAAQEACWRHARDSEYAARPDAIRRDLSRAEVGADDARVRLVGLDAYEAAGGALRRDLFSDAVFVADIPLLERLVQAAISEAAELVRAEGWSDVEIGGDAVPVWDPRRLDGEEWEPSAAEEAEIGELDDATRDLTVAQEVRLSLLQDNRFTDEEKAVSVARVRFERHGLVIIRGILRDGASAPHRDDELDEDDDGHAGDGRDDDGSLGTTVNQTAKPAEKDPAAIPQRLVYDLTLRRTGELRVAMSREPGKAVQAFTAALAEDWRREFSSGGHGFGVTLRHTADAGDAYGAIAEVWKKRLAFAEPVLDWLSAQQWETTLELLAFVAAESLDVVKRYPSQAALGDELARYLDIDLADHWRPDAEFLQQMPAAAIHAALEEVGITDEGLARCRKMKKTELAGYAEEYLRATRWVPACVRWPPAPPSPKQKPVRGKAAAAGDA